MTSQTFAQPVARPSLLAALIAFVAARLGRPSKPETDYDVWTSGARGL